MVEEQSNRNMWWTWHDEVCRLQQDKAIEPAQKHQIIHRQQHVTQWLAKTINWKEEEGLTPPTKEGSKEEATRRWDSG